MEIKAATVICVTNIDSRPARTCGCSSMPRWFIQIGDVVKIKLNSYSRTLGPQITGKILDIEVFNGDKNQHIKIDCSKAFQSRIETVNVHDIDEIEILEGLV